MVINFVVAIGVSAVTKPPPKDVRELVQRIRVPSGAGVAHEMQIPPARQGE
jgi:cation/acetate symporter